MRRTCGRLLQRALCAAATMALGMCLLAIAPCVASAAGTVDGVTVRDCDVTTPASGKVLVGLKGSYDQVSAQKVLDKLNGIRKEACEEGVWNPENPSARLTMSDYKPLVWSADLEYITMLRAAEASVTRGHVRADGDSIWLKAPSGQQGWAEDLAWNYDDLLYGIDQFYGEKDDWVNKNSAAVTGHYTSMISPRYASVGASAFLQDAKTAATWPCTVAMQLSHMLPTSEERLAPKGVVYQLIEMKASSISSLKVKGLGNGASVGDSRQAYVVGSAAYNGNVAKNALISSAFMWKTSNADVADVTQTGFVTAKGSGDAVISAADASTGGVATAALHVSASSGKPSAGEADGKELSKVKSVSFTVKAGKSVRLSAGPAYSVSGNRIVYVKKSGTGKVKVSKNGKVTVSKGLKKAKTYKVVLSVSCNGQSKQIAIKIKVK